MPEKPARCFYCLDEHVSIGVCVGCRTRLEMAEMRVKTAERNAEAWKKNYYRLLSERRREIRRGAR